MLLKISPDTLDLVHSLRPDQSVWSTAFYLNQYIISYLYLLFLAFFLDEFHFRWLKIYHYQDRNESSNSYFDSVVCDYLKWNLPEFININCCKPAQCCQALAQRIICIFHYSDFFFFLTMSIHYPSEIPFPSLCPSSSVLLEHFSFMISSIWNWEGGE